MQDIFPSLDGLFLGLPGHYSIALTTLLLCVLTALYFANFFKDKTELEDEGLGNDEIGEEDDEDLVRSPLEEETDDDEAYEENTSDSDMEFIGGQEQQQHPGQNYQHLMGQLKAKRLQQKLEKTLTPGQIEEERRIEREQLAAIFELLRKQEAELNLQDRISDQELKEQVRLYR